MTTATLTPTRRTLADIAAKFGSGLGESLIDRAEYYADRLYERIDAEPDDKAAYDLHVRFDAWIAWRERLIRYGLKAGVLEVRKGDPCTMALDYDDESERLYVTYTDLGGERRDCEYMPDLHGNPDVPACLADRLAELRAEFPFEGEAAWAKGLFTRKGE